jgi:hypothetical protein
MPTTSLQAGRGFQPTTSSGQHVLMPNRLPADRAHQIIMVEATSRDRNYNNQVVTNPLKFQFQRPLKDVRSVELVSGTVPAYPYNFNSYNNAFLFQEGTTTWTLTIPPGYYTESRCVSKLESQIAVLSGITNTYTVTQDTATKQLVVTRTAGSASFAMRFATAIKPDSIDHSDGYFLQQNTPATLLGFDLNDYYDTAGVITSPFPLDVYSSINRIYIYINLDNTQNLGCIERGAGRRSPFAVIYLDQERNGYKYLNKETLTPASYSLPQPYSRLQALNIEFRDEWYRLIDFDGKDFSLLLQITVLE